MLINEDEILFDLHDTGQNREVQHFRTPNFAFFYMQGIVLKFLLINWGEKKIEKTIWKFRGQWGCHLFVKMEGKGGPVVFSCWLCVPVNTHPHHNR